MTRRCVYELGDVGECPKIVYGIVVSVENTGGQVESFAHGDEIDELEANWKRSRFIIIVIAVSVGLVMTGFGIVIPVFGRRLGEFGSGVEGLGAMITAFALAQFAFSPFMGSLADRIGRRPIILISLTGHLIANIAFLFAPSTEYVIAIRAFQGAATAGMFPAAVSMVADIAPIDKRSHWMGIVVAASGAGFATGAVFGGLLYDQWGFEAAFIAPAVAALIAIGFTLSIVPETLPAHMRQQGELIKEGVVATGSLVNRGRDIMTSLPRPLFVFGGLLFIDFVAVFAFTFTEPQLVFYVYDDLGWTTAQFGFIVGGFGFSMLIGQVFFGRLIDRIGRKPIIVVSAMVMTSFYFALSVVTTFNVILVVALLSGLGTSLLSPALNALYLDMTDEQYRSRIFGIKRSAMSLGSVTGPVVVAIVSQFAEPQRVFLFSTLFAFTTVVIAITVLRESSRSVHPSTV